MCRIEERVYIGADGNRSKFEDTYPCSKARNGRLCAKVNKRTTEYYPKKGAIARSDTPSPVNPPTPVGTGTYLVQQRRPSSSGARPSTRDGPKQIKPEIIIEFGDKNKISVSAKKYKRPSLDTGSADDVALESPGSDASHTVRTGLPEAPVPPQTSVYGHADSYGATPTIPHGYHHRHTSSTSSCTGSSRTPSLYVTSSDYESPTTSRNTRLPPAIHNPPTAVAPPSPSRPYIHGGNTSASYNTTLVSPHYSQESHLSEGLFPMDNHDFADRSASSLASSGASGPSRRGKDHDQLRKKKQEEFDRQVAEALAEKLSKEENVKQVRFEIDRAEGRAKERAENLFAEKEKQRAKDREDARQRAHQEREKEAAKERKKEKEKPKVHASNSSSKRPTTSRKQSVSMTPAQQEEQRRLLAADLGHMQSESHAAEAREREENMALLIQQQQDTSYYNPRAGPMPNGGSALTRRDSQSRRNSLSGDARPTLGLGRSNSNRRTSIVQPNLPSGNAQRPPPSARTHAPPPVSFPTNFNTRPQSTRRPSFTQENPFAAPPTRGSNSSVENPFASGAPTRSPPVTVHQDPWDARNMLDALPKTQTVSDGRHATQRRTGEVTHGYGSHAAAREATRAMGRFAGHDSAFVTDSEDELPKGHRRRGY